MLVLLAQQQDDHDDNNNKTKGTAADPDVVGEQRLEETVHVELQ
jgi:hypothetical protein